MRYYKIGRSVLVSLLVVLSTSFVPRLPMVLMTSGVLAQTVDARKAEADRFLQQGIKQYQNGQFTVALQSWEQALKIYREIKNIQGESAALGNIGLVYNSLGDYPKAIDYHQQSLAIARKIKDRKSEVKSLRNLGLVYDALRDYSKAIDYYQQSLKIVQEIKDPNGEAQLLRNIGLVYDALRDYPKAINYLQQSLKIVQEIKDPNGEAQLLRNIGLVYNSLRDYPKAINYLQQSLKIVQKIKNPNGEAQLLRDIGIAYYRLENYLKAIENYQQSLKIAWKINDIRGKGAASGSIGVAYNYLGDYPKAIKYQQQSLKIAQEIKDPNSEVVSLVNLSNTYYLLGDYPEAIKYLQQSLKIAREIKNRSYEGQSLGNLGIAYDSLGDYPKAIEYHQKSLAILRKIEDRRGEGKSLGNLGIAHSNLGNYLKAIDYQQQSLKIAREIKDRHSEGQLLGNIGLAYDSLEDYPKAIKYHQQRLAIAREIKDRRGEGAALNNLGLVYHKQGNLTLAENTLIEGIKVNESLRGKELKDSQKVTYFDTQRSTYRILQKVLIAQNKTDTALEISERGRGRAFVELLASRISTNSQEQSPKPPNIEGIKQIAKAQNSTLVQYSIIADEFKIAGKPKTKQSELYIWVIKPTGEVTFRKADLKPLWQKENTTLRQLVSTTRKSLGVGDDERSIFSAKFKNPVNEKIQRESLQKLHQLLLKPIADLLPTDPNQRVTFVPQRDLFLVPFPALMDSKGKYLIEKHTILTAPAIQVLELTRQQQQRIKSLPAKSRKNALIVGNPTMPSFNTKYGEPGKQLSSLPGAKREAEAIAPLFNTIALTGDEATETAIKAKLPQAGLIHLATHGLFDGFQGLQSSIALAPSSQDNGLLSASEILHIKLNADLVVLSACNTGRGRITGDGVIGLSRSLISSGVPSVLVSLWSVPDSPTASLMTDFYQNLSKNPDKATALREAMLARMKQHPNPRDWAAFTLIGEGS